MLTYEKRDQAEEKLSMETLNMISLYDVSFSLSFLLSFFLSFFALPL